MSEPLSEPVTLKVSKRLHRQLEEEAKKSGQQVGPYCRTILEEHFSGSTLASVRAHIEELTHEVSKLRQEAQEGGRVEGLVTDLALKNASLERGVREFSATLHYALEVLAYNPLRPSEDAYRALQSKLERLVELYGGRPNKQ